MSILTRYKNPCAAQISSCGTKIHMRYENQNNSMEKDMHIPIDPMHDVIGREMRDLLVRVDEHVRERVDEVFAFLFCLPEDWLCVCKF